MIIISDTSIITDLIQVGQLGLLEKLFNEIIIHQKVSEELLRSSGRENLFEKYNWINIQEITNKNLYDQLLKRVDPGEAESIVLAIELKADLLLIDERKGRQVAEEYGIVITGLIGVLINAKEQGFLEKIKPILDKLIYEIGFRISPRLYQQVLKMVNE